MNDYTKRIQMIIDIFQLEPHPEGGFYRETYRSDLSLDKNSLPKEFSGTRSCSTGIFFLLEEGSFSAFHRILSDEMWHFYEGDPLIIHMISKEGEYSAAILGQDYSDHQRPQLVVPAGYYFAVELVSKGKYALTGCTVSPGFDFHDFSMPGRSELTALFPEHADLIRRLTY